MTPITKGKYFILLASLVVLGALYPVLEQGPTGVTIWTVALWLVLYGGQHAVGALPKSRILTGALAGMALVSGLVWVTQGGYVSGPPLLLALMMVAHLAFLGLTTVLIFLDVLGGFRVDLDKILGAVCIYILLGVTFAFLYATVHAVALTLGSTQAAISPEPTGFLMGDYLYFSFCTLTTLGYGDLVPTGPFARLFASVEVMTGQLYLAILVARLVGLHISQHGD